MSSRLVSLNPDLRRLRDEGLEVEISSSGYLLIHQVPYVNSRKQVAYGTLASTLTLAGERTVRPDTHVVLFTGDEPSYADGSLITAIRHGAVRQLLAPGLESQYSFSNKPAGGYDDYHAKMSRYIAILSHPAISINSNVSPYTHKPIAATEQDSVFEYLDTASSRVGITEATNKLKGHKVGIIGLGGTGAYVLDFLAKTPVGEINLFDADLFLQHNAFRCPGAASLEDLQRRMKKVHYLAELYSRMHRKIVPHDYSVKESDIEALRQLDFVFVCVDKGAARQTIMGMLFELGIPFIDVGLGVMLLPHEQSLIGIVRTTFGTREMADHIKRKVPCADEDLPDEYSSNIQIAELNALNAALAVIRWKKHAGFYHDDNHEHHSTFTLSTSQLLSEDFPDEGGTHEDSSDAAA
jgi:tRNA A37 threonylcarbamoyladenosine dehydratase